MEVVTACVSNVHLARPEVERQNHRNYPRIQKWKISWSITDLAMFEMQDLQWMWWTSLGSVCARRYDEVVVMGVKGVLEKGMVLKTEMAQELRAGRM
jgi:hypothetical protein